MTDQSDADKKPDTERLKPELEEAAETAGRHARKFFAQASEGQDSLLNAVRAEPLKATLIALGAGFLLGLLARR